MTPEQAVLRLRADPEYADLVRDAYFDADVGAAAARFEASAEFQELLEWLGGVDGKSVLDLGSGNGVAAVAFAHAGAREVIAMEPDPSAECGRGALKRVDALPPTIRAVDGVGESLPLAGGAVDVVYARQVLHHIRDLPAALGECYRVLRPGGRLVACRDHVVDDAEQLEAFLSAHPVHQMTGGENAYPLPAYIGAIAGAGFVLDRVVGPLDSIVNAFPAARSRQDVDEIPRRELERRFGRLGGACAAIPGVDRVVRAILDRPYPGRLYSFIATKPA